MWVSSKECSPLSALPLLLSASSSRGSVPLPLPQVGCGPLGVFQLYWDSRVNAAPTVKKVSEPQPWLLK